MGQKLISGWAASQVTELTIDWPSGILQELKDVAINRVITVTEPQLQISASPSITLNPQTGLFEQTLQLLNPEEASFIPFQINITGLPEDVEVYNASGIHNGIPHVEFNRSGKIENGTAFLIEYYRPSREPFESPDFSITFDPIREPASPPGDILEINRQLISSDQRFLIEFSTIPGQRYVVEYSYGMENWLAASVPVRAGGTRVLWHDDGPPKTDSKPTQVGERFYRVVLLPEE